MNVYEEYLMIKEASLPGSYAKKGAIGGAALGGLGNTARGYMKGRRGKALLADAGKGAAGGAVVGGALGYGAGQHQQIKDHEGTIRDRDATIKGHEGTIRDRDATIKGHEGTIRDQKRSILDRNQLVVKQHKDLEDLRSSNKKLQQQNKNLIQRKANSEFRNTPNKKARRRLRG